MPPDHRPKKKLDTPPGGNLEPRKLRYREEEESAPYTLVKLTPAWPWPKGSVAGGTIGRAIGREQDG